MSQSGKFVFFTRTPDSMAGDSIAALVRLLEPFAIVWARCSQGPERGWADFLASRRTATPAAGATERQRWDFLESRMTHDQLPHVAVGDACLDVLTKGSPLVGLLASEVETSIHVKDRATFNYTDLYLRLGWHDVFECAENDRGTLFGRASVSIRFHGAGTPADWASCRSALYRLGATNRLTQQLRGVWADVDMTAFWWI